MYLFMGCRVDAQKYGRMDAYDISEEEDAKVFLDGIFDIVEKRK